MKGTAVLINHDRIVSVLENIDVEVYKEIVSQEDEEEVCCTIDEKEVTFGPITKVVWLEDHIDWQYGY